MNTQAIRASFQSINLEGVAGSRSPLFTYYPRNSRDSDYELGDDTEIHIFLKDGESYMPCSDFVKLDLPIFVPAGKTVATSVHFKLVEPDAPASDDIHQVGEFLRGKERLWNKLDEFVLFDKKYRYQIDFPKPPQ